MAFGQGHRARHGSHIESRRFLRRTSCNASPAPVPILATRKYATTLVVGRGLLEFLMSGMFHFCAYLSSPFCGKPNIRRPDRVTVAQSTSQLDARARLAGAQFRPWAVDIKPLASLVALRGFGELVLPTSEPMHTHPGWSEGKPVPGRGATPIRSRRRASHSSRGDTVPIRARECRPRTGVTTISPLPCLRGRGAFG